MYINLTDKDLEILICCINEEIGNCKRNIKKIEDSGKVEVFKLANSFKDRIVMLVDLKEKLVAATEVKENV